MTHIDLSHTITSNTPVYPGDPKVVISPEGDLDVAGFQDHVITMGTHVGTHIDAPAHMIKGGKTLDEYPVDRFTGTALVCEMSSGLPVLDGIDAIFFYTGASDKFEEESYWRDYNVIPKDIIEYILPHSIKLVGVDTGSVDNEDGFPIHKKLLGHDILIVENLTNLKDLVGKKVEFTALPLSVALDGAPCRVIARI